MLWSLTKVLIFVAIVAILAFGAGLLMETSGEITVEFGSIGFSLTPLQTVIALAAIVAVVWISLKVFSLLIALLRFINGDETAFSRFFDRNRQRRGVDALSEGLVALASGDAKTAMTKAKKADRLLDKPDVTNLIIAQAAEQSGDKRAAEDTYKKLLEHDKTRFVGIRGLLKQKLESGDTETALKLAEKAFAIAPSHVETQDTLFKLQTGDEDWAGARRTLEAKLNQGALPRDVHRRRDGVMALSAARLEREAGRLDDAQTLAIEANRLSPDLIPAATLTAKGYVEQGKPKLAERVLKSAWSTQPHPDLAAAFAAVYTDETPEARIKRFEGLVRANAKHAESRMVMAELHIANEDFSAARAALGDLVDTAPTMRSLTIMAAIERGEAAPDDIVRALLTKAIVAQRDPEWVCDSCGELHKSWEPVCFNCEAFDSISWKAPASPIQSASTAILPMIAAATPEIAPEVAEIDPADVEVIEGLSEINVDKPA